MSENFKPLKVLVCGKSADGGIYPMLVDSEGKPLIAGALTLRGTWNATTNTPTLADGGVGGDNGDFYVVSVSGSTTIDGISSWSVGDWILNDGSNWLKADHTDVVTSVAGRQGAVEMYTALTEHIRGGGFAILTGVKGYIWAPDKMNITSVKFRGDAAGAIQVTIGNVVASITLAGSPAVATYTPGSPVAAAAGEMMVVNVVDNTAACKEIDFAVIGVMVA